MDTTPEPSPAGQAGGTGHERSGPPPGADDGPSAVGPDDGADRSGGDPEGGGDDRWGKGESGEAAGAGDVEADGDAVSEEVQGRDPLRFSNWMKRSATGAVMTGISIGLREALEQKGNEPALMIEASGQPDDPDHPIRLHFDPDSPADSVAVIRRPKDPERDLPGDGPPTR